MQIPDYYLKRPVVSREKNEDFDQLYRSILERDSTAEIDYTLKAPKWQFLCYLSDTKNILLHGSVNPAIEEFEPRQSIDADEFGNRRAIYAASDGIWAMFFALVDRTRVTSLVNTCCRIRQTEDRTPESYYYFSIDEEALPQHPWCSGMVYLLPKNTFEQQEAIELAGAQIEISQWASPVSVKPIAKIAVSPGDFPFLNKVNGHDPVVVSERASLNPNNFPWRD